jgi:predicted outer membrane protein
LRIFLFGVSKMRNLKPRRTIMKHCTALSLLLAVAATFAVPAWDAAAQTSDREFVREAASGGRLEVELGNLAIQRAASNAVRDFAQRLVIDHSAANAELAGLSAQKGISLPQSLLPKHAAMRDRLSGLSGPDFDRAYMQQMVSDHNEDIAAFQREAQSGSAPEIKAWAAKTLPTLQQHLALAQTVNNQVAGLPGTGIVAASPTTVVVIPRAAWCGGGYEVAAGSNFGSCSP